MPTRISLHGRDNRYPRGGGGFKAQLEERSKEVGIAGGSWPFWFPGKQLSGGARLAVRLRWTWEAWRLPPIPAKKVKTGTNAYAVTPPSEPGVAMDVDIVVHSEEAWPGSGLLREYSDDSDQAVRFGPLVDASGQHLMATAVLRLAYKSPLPPSVTVSSPMSRDDATRMLAAGLDEAGVLWLVETAASRAAYEDRQARIPERGS